MVTHDVIEAHRTMSSLGIYPLVFDIPSHDEKMVAWLGVIMPWKVALAIVNSHYGCYSSPKVKDALTMHTRRLFQSQAFSKEFTDAHMLTVLNIADIVEYFRGCLRTKIPKAMESINQVELYRRLRPAVT